MDLLIEICGWMGSFCYAVYCIPQAFDAFKSGKTEGLSSGTVLLLFFGGLGSLIYILPDISSPLFYNFLISVMASSTILKYHFFPRQ